MGLEYIVRVPTPIGTIDLLFGNNGIDIGTLLEVKEEDKRGFRLLGLDPNKLPLVEKDIFETLEGIVISPASGIEFHDFVNGRIKTLDSPPSLAGVVADTYSSIAALNREVVGEYKLKVQELEGGGEKILKHSRKADYLFYIGTGAAIAIAIAGSIHPTTNLYTLSAATILMLGTFLYHKKVSARIDASYERRINEINQYLDESTQQAEAFQNAFAKLTALKETLLGTGWFPVGYGK